MKTKHRKLRGFTLVELLVVIVIIAALAGLSAPMILRQRKAADRTQAISNAKQVGLALLEFDTEYGGFPDDDTLEDLNDSLGESYSFGSETSNDYLRQLVAFGIKSEDIFFAKTAYTRKPDKVIDPISTEALQAGEVGYGYVLITGSDGGSRGLSTSGNPGVPVLVAPLIEGSTDWEFDSDPYGGKAVVLRLDSSVEAPIIQTTGSKVSIGGGKTLDETGTGTVWGTVNTPDLKAPQPR